MVGDFKCLFYKSSEIPRRNTPVHTRRGPTVFCAVRCMARQSSHYNNVFANHRKQYSVTQHKFANKFLTSGWAWVKQKFPAGKIRFDRDCRLVHFHSDTRIRWCRTLICYIRVYYLLYSRRQGAGIGWSAGLIADGGD